MFLVATEVSRPPRIQDDAENREGRNLLTMEESFDERVLVSDERPVAAGLLMANLEASSVCGLPDPSTPLWFFLVPRRLEPWCG